MLCIYRLQAHLTLGTLLHDGANILSVHYKFERYFLAIFKYNLGFGCSWNTLSLFMQFKGNKQKIEGHNVSRKATSEFNNGEIFWAI